jgi:hypothetical protein
MDLLKPREKTMNALQKRFLFTAAAGVATWVFIQSPSAQTIHTDRTAAAQATMEQAIKEMGVPSKSPAAAQDKANAAMTGSPVAPPSEAERKAVAEMSK